MSKLKIEKIDAIKGKQEIFQLVIDDVKQFDAFCDDIDSSGGQYAGECKKIATILERVANLDSLPKNKFRVISKSGEDAKEYEVKSKHLRVYLISKEKGKIIILCGYKNTQPKDISKFRSLKNQFLGI